MPGDDGSFDASPPPMSGLGNFKGVMLCNRPSEDMAHVGSEGPGPFRSMIASSYGEQLGLTPFKSAEPTGAVKSRGPSAALRRHVKWLRELQDQMNSERRDVEAEDVKAQERLERMKATFDGHRDGVRQMLKERKETLYQREQEEMLNRRNARVAAKEASAAAKVKPAPKPMWAMTEKEKDAFNEGEADALIDFAEGLDFESFVRDEGFREGLLALKDRAGKLSREQEAFKDALLRDFNARASEEDGSTSAGGSPRGGNLEEGLEGQSVLGDLRSEYSVGSRKARGHERYGADADAEKDWDASTRCDEDRPRQDADVRSIAESVLESNPRLKTVHSKDSIQKVIERAREVPASSEAAAD